MEEKVKSKEWYRGYQKAQELWDEGKPLINPFSWWSDEYDGFKAMAETVVWFYYVC